MTKPYDIAEAAERHLDDILALVSACEPRYMLIAFVTDALKEAFDAGRASIIANPLRHVSWGAGDPDCPSDIKAPNGELHTLRCKVCGSEDFRTICTGEKP